MNVRILIPTKILFDGEVTRLAAEGHSGAFGILPRHIDFVEPLTRGILSLRRPDGSELFAAVNEGLLVKQGNTVMISTPAAVLSEHLPRLNETVAREFLDRDEREREARSAMARLESDFIRHFIEQAR